MSKLKKAEKVLALVPRFVPKICLTDGRREVVSYASGLIESELMKVLANGYYMTEIKGTKEDGGKSEKLTKEGVPSGHYKMDGGESKNLTEEKIPNATKEDVKNSWPWGEHAPYGCKCPEYAYFICLGPTSSEMRGN